MAKGQVVASFLGVQFSCTLMYMARIPERKQKKETNRVRHFERPTPTKQYARHKTKQELFAMLLRQWQ